jgi:hypothetical protein
MTSVRTKVVSADVAIHFNILHYVLLTSSSTISLLELSLRLSSLSLFTQYHRPVAAQRGILTSKKNNFTFTFTSAPTAHIPPRISDSRCPPSTRLYNTRIQLQYLILLTPTRKTAH